MGFCDSPDNVRKKRKRKTSYSTGRNAGDRVRGKPFRKYREIDWIKHQPEDMVTIPAAGTLIDVSDKFEEMYDTHGFIQEWWNPCVHTRFSTSDGRDLPVIEDVDGVILDFQSTSPGLYPGFAATLPFLSAADLDDLAVRSAYKLSTVVEQSTSIINFLLEIISVIGGIIKGIEKFAQIWEKIWKAFENAYKRFRKQGHKEAAAYWLAWNFAIKPAIADLKAIICSMSETLKKLEWLRRNNDRIIHLTYARDMTDKLPLSQEWRNSHLVCTVLKADPPGTPVNGGYWQQLWFAHPNLKLKYISRSKVHLSIPGEFLDGAMAVNVLWSVLMGVTNPTFIVWEAIPFSWLIDYFLTFRARLWQKIYAWNPYNEGVHVLEMGHSWTYSGIVPARVRVIGGPSEWTFHGYNSIQFKAYVREKGLPTGGQATYFQWGLNAHRISLLGSIIVSSGKRRR